MSKLVFFPFRFHISLNRICCFYHSRKIASWCLYISRMIKEASCFLRLHEAEQLKTEIPFLSLSLSLSRSLQNLLFFFTALKFKVKSIRDKTYTRYGRAYINFSKYTRFRRPSTCWKQICTLYMLRCTSMKKNREKKRGKRESSFAVQRTMVLYLTSTHSGLE